MHSGGCDLMFEGWDVVMQTELADLVTQIVNYQRYSILYHTTFKRIGRPGNASHAFH